MAKIRTLGYKKRKNRLLSINLHVAFLSALFKGSFKILVHKKIHIRTLHYTSTWFRFLHSLFEKWLVIKHGVNKHFKEKPSWQNLCFPITSTVYFAIYQLLSSLGRQDDISRYFCRELAVTSSTANSWKSASLQTIKHTVTRSISYIQPLKSKTLCVFLL